jgi:hypothetical protein
MDFTDKHILFAYQQVSSGLDYRFPECSKMF